MHKGHLIQVASLKTPAALSPSHAGLVRLYRSDASDQDQDAAGVSSNGLPLIRCESFVVEGRLSHGRGEGRGGA